MDRRISPITRAVADLERSRAFYGVMGWSVMAVTAPSPAQGASWCWSRS